MSIEFQIKNYAGLRILIMKKNVRNYKNTVNVKKSLQILFGIVKTGNGELDVNKCGKEKHNPDGIGEPSRNTCGLVRNLL